MESIHVDGDKSIRDARSERDYAGTSALLSFIVAGFGCAVWFIFMKNDSAIKIRTFLKKKRGGGLLCRCVIINKLTSRDGLTILFSEWIRLFLSCAPLGLGKTLALKKKSGHTAQRHKRKWIASVIGQLQKTINMRVHVHVYANTWMLKVRKMYHLPISYTC